MPDAQAPDIRIYVLDGGRIETWNAGIFSSDGNYEGEHWDMPNPCYLIVHPKGTLLWDCGLSDSLADLPNGYSTGPGRAVLSMPRRIAEQLEQLGTKPEDIDYLVLSHSHLDHTGNANLFQRSTWIVDEAEHEFMFSDAARANERGFSTYDQLEGATKRMFDADHDVFGDGSVTILRAPGHTPGHTALLVKLAQSGPVLFSGDLWYSCRCRTLHNIPPHNTSREQTLRSMQRIEQIAKDVGARIVIQHDRSAWETMPSLPGYLS